MDYVSLKNLSSTLLGLGWNLFFKYYNFGYFSQNFVTEKGIEMGTKRFQGKEAAECAVCLCNIDRGEEIGELRCDHLFHRVCLDRWIGYRHVTCPLCRGSLFSQSKAGELGQEVLVFNFCSFSSRESDNWWLR